MTSSATIFCFGETLWDLLPGGHRPGGLPCRVALHLRQLGQPAQLISRVGDDELGHELLNLLTTQGLDSSLVQLSDSHLTGVVKAPQPGRPGGQRYRIVQPLAWDYIHYTEALRETVGQGSILVYGTLAARSPMSRETLYRLLPHAAFRVLDLNLHPAHYSRQVVKYLLQQADLLKLSEAELAEIMAWQGQEASAETALPWLASKYGFKAICLMREATGASLYVDGTWWHSPAFEAATHDVESYGAAFLAALLAGWAGGHLPADCLRRACAAGAVVVRQHDTLAPTLTEDDLHLMLHPA